MSGVPRMRSIPSCVKELQAIDPNTAFTLRALRRMVNNGEIPVVEVASKKLINFDLLLERLSCAGTGSESAQPVSGFIRPVPEKLGR